MQVLPTADICIEFPASLPKSVSQSGCQDGGFPYGLGLSMLILKWRVKKKEVQRNQLVLNSLLRGWWLNVSNHPPASTSPPFDGRYELPLAVHVQIEVLFHLGRWLGGFTVLHGTKIQPARLKQILKMMQHDIMIPWTNRNLKQSNP